MMASANWTYCIQRPDRPGFAPEFPVSMADKNPRHCTLYDGRYSTWERLGVKPVIQHDRAIWRSGYGLHPQFQPIRKDRPRALIARIGRKNAEKPLAGRMKNTRMCDSTRPERGVVVQGRAPYSPFLIGMVKWLAESVSGSK